MKHYSEMFDYKYYKYYSLFILYTLIIEILKLKIEKLNLSRTRHYLKIVGYIVFQNNKKL